MDPAVSGIGTISSFGEHFGFPALLVVALLYGINRMLEQAREERAFREQLDRDLEKERRAEREIDRAAHLGALEKLGTRFNTYTEIISANGEKLSRILLLWEEDRKRSA